MVERLHSGVPGLDEVLGGGLQANSINLIMGLPGTGKTLLAQQYAFAQGTVERPAIYLSTVSEPYEKIIRYGQTLRFFDVDAVGQRVFYDDLGEALLEHGLPGVLDRVGSMLNEREPGLLVIDSFRPFVVLAESAAAHRRFLHELAGRLSVNPVTTLWLGEYAVGDIAHTPEFAIADAVVWLASARLDQREVRTLQVLKLRGSGFLSGKHAYRLSDDGMRVFPRLADPAEHGEYELAPGLISSGVRGFDRILGDGYRSGSSTLVIGPSGVGKTVLGLHYAFEGVRHKHPTVFATFDENPSQLERTAAGFGWSLAVPELQLMYRSAVDLYLDEWVYDLLELIDLHEIRRVFIDGMAKLRAAAFEPVRFQEHMYSLVQRCSRRGVDLMMSLESPELFGLTRLSETPLSQIADNVVLLQFVRLERDYRRAITVLKSRSAQTEPHLSEYVIGPTGFEVRSRDNAKRRR